MAVLERYQKLVDNRETWSYEYGYIENELNSVYCDMIHRSIFADNEKPHDAIITNTTIDNIFDCYNEAKNNDFNFEF